ncbi:MAG: putative porin [Rhodospirillales bacterium]|nr:putative porin [Acetobacter sp.]
MKALLSIGYGCILAALTPGWCCAQASDNDLPRTELALNAPTEEAASATPADGATTAAAPKSTPAPCAPVSENVTINLINRLVQRGVLTKEDADDLIKQAEADTVKARAQASATGRTTADLPPATDPSLFRQPATTLSTDIPPAPVTFPPPADAADDVRVTYVPTIVRKQIADEVRQELALDAKDRNLVPAESLPRWVLRLTPFADFRLRYEGLFFPDGNDNTGAFPNFNAINTGSPFDTTGSTFSPQTNVDRDRNRFRVRVRFGAEMSLDDGFTFGLRISTGDTNNPVSANQTFGYANGGQGGNFSRYAIWLDRAFVRYELGGTPSRDLVLNIGRTDNPFFAPSELVWFDDLGFDGLSISGRYQVSKYATPFATLGAFPIFNTELNFSSNRPSKFSSEDKYLLAVQAGSTFAFGKYFSAKVAGAYYDFENVQGRRSSPFVPLTTSDQGNTDDSRPSFAQKGNTYFPIRDILPTADNNFGTTRQYQYFGLATPYRVVDFSGTLDYARFDPFHLSLYGEYVQNVAFDRGSVNAIAVNNRGPDRGNGQLGTFAGGNVGWIIGLRVGAPVLEKRWDWYVGAAYQYEESDATIDGFNDPNFGLGGTNLKGYRLFGAVALSKRINLFVRWLSANEVAGPTFRNDTLQFDFNAKF